MDSVHQVILVIYTQHGPHRKRPNFPLGRLDQPVRFRTVQCALTYYSCNEERYRVYRANSPVCLHAFRRHCEQSIVRRSTRTGPLYELLVIWRFCLRDALFGLVPTNSTYVTYDKFDLRLMYKKSRYGRLVLSP
jgi:hypothetical protein